MDFHLMVNRQPLEMVPVLFYQKTCMFWDELRRDFDQSHLLRRGISEENSAPDAGRRGVSV